MNLQGEQTSHWFQRAAQVLPYGVNSNFRYWGDQDTLVVQRARGAYLWDMDGKRYIDYRLGFGPVILGHAEERVNRAVAEAIKDGILFAWTTPGEVELAERIVRLTGVEMVRLANSGTEATMQALRIARAYTGREKYVKFEGHYHGSADYFMYSTASASLNMLGSPHSPIPAPMSSGMPARIAETVIVLPFNELDGLERTIKARWGEIAAVFVEPVMGNVGGILPQEEFLPTLRCLCDEYGIILVFDEVKTGFRIAKGGAQEYFNVRADLVTYAKALGNGFPIAAIGGKREVMMTIVPGQVSQSGTYNGNTVAVAAALATLELFEKEPIHETVWQRGQALMKGIDEILSDHGIEHALTGLPPMFGIHLGSSRRPQNFRDFLKGNAALYSQLVRGLARRGVLPDIDGREPWFLCAALSEEDIQETLNVLNDTVRELKREGKIQ
ncbi:MAG: guanitoxin biosynthesis PLP-dependent transaminase GntE [Anaerolineales bacterium]|nr:aspartate aminotransferase family protein [Anaerolineales bacterium]MDW8446352.1 guanitoxin biosynthesis PLP-dependent transaminase GntE [Anaerolineales bacterium]